MALAPDSSLIIADHGTPMEATWSPRVRKGVWQILPLGRYRFSGVPGVPSKPSRLGPADWNLEFPVAVVTDAALPWNFFVLDRVASPASQALYRLTSPNFSAAVRLPGATGGALGMIWPVAMARDNNSHLLILDRGTSPPSGAPSAPKIIDVDVSVTPVRITSRNLTPAKVVEPLSLLVLTNGDLIIGDGREQNAATPGDLVRIDRSNPLTWVESRLLAPLEGHNPLTAPVAVVREDAAHLFVLDVGLKPILPPSGTPFIRIIAEPAAVYRVDLSQAPPTIVRASESRGLVFPTGMVLEKDKLYICDLGEYSDPNFSGALPAVWRARPYEFGVVVHFSSQRPTTQKQRRQIVNDINEVIAKQKPAHVAATFVYAAV